MRSKHTTRARDQFKEKKAGHWDLEQNIITRKTTFGPGGGTIQKEAFDWAEEVV